MSSSPLSVAAVGAAEALGGGAMALWRQAQAQTAQPTSPLTPASEVREEAAQPAAPAQTPAQQPATPMRLSELRLDAMHLAHTLPPLHEAPHRPARWRPGEESAPAPEEAAEPPPEHWLVSLARRWTQAEHPAAQQALQLARAQWATGRRVLLVCGMPGSDFAVSEAPGWAALLHGGPGPGGLLLDGPRWPVRLMWRAAAPAASQWFRTRLVKESAPGQSWQMKPFPAPGEAALQIGPALEAQRPWTDLGVRLEGGSAFRAALGTQWSLWLMATRGCWMNE